MENCKSIATLVNITNKTQNLDKSPLTLKEEDMKNISFQEAVGCLMHAMVCTRLDISFAMGQVSRHVSNPRHNDWTYIKRVFKYLRGTSTRGISYGGPNNSLELIGLYNVNWARKLESKKSTFGYCFLLSGRIIS
jgi:hypothetical protein